MKVEERLLRSSGLTKEATALRLKWRAEQHEYNAFCYQNHRPVEPYRYIIDENEVKDYSNIMGNLQNDLQSVENDVTIEAKEEVVEEKPVVVNPWENDLPPRGHTKIPQGETRVTFVAKELHIPEEKAVTIVQTIDDWSYDAYANIRKYQTGEYVDNEKVAREQSETIEEFIKISPRWNGGETFRGVGLTKEEFDKYIVGNTYDMKGTSSWTTDFEDTALYFATRVKKDVPVVFRCKTQKKGTSIMHLSGIEDECEVLCSRDSKYRILQVQDARIDGIGEIKEILMEEIE